MTTIDWIHSKILFRIALPNEDIIQLRGIIKEAKERERLLVLDAYKDGHIAADYYDGIINNLIDLTQIDK